MGKEKDTKFSYFYYLFQEGNERHPLEVRPIEMDLDTALEKSGEYTNINNISSLTSNCKFYLFNMLASSNQNLLNYVIRAYNENGHPRSQIKEGLYDYVAVMAKGNNSVDYDFLKFKYQDRPIDINPNENKNKKLNLRDKLVPTMYFEDFEKIQSICKSANIDVDYIDLNNPRKLLVKLFAGINEIIRTKDAIDGAFYTDLKDKCYSVLRGKYVFDYNHTDEADRDAVGTIYEYDVKNIINLLNSGLIITNFEQDSTLYYNLLSLITNDLRIRDRVNEISKEYIPTSKKVGDDFATPYYLAKTAIYSLKDLDMQTELYATEEPKHSFGDLADKHKVYEEYFINYILFRYPNLSSDDVINHPEEYADIIQEINDAYAMKKAIVDSNSEYYDYKQETEGNKAR